jgi:hypothetical protein
VPRSTKLKRSIIISAEDVVNELGELEAPAFMRWAATLVQTEMPTLVIKDCRSVLFLFGRWREREVYARKYEPCPECGAILGHSPNCSIGEEDD